VFARGAFVVQASVVRLYLLLDFPNRFHSCF
jgi:hypothetical protein